MTPESKQNKVVMVDDDSIAIKLYTMLLKSNDWELATFESAEEAISYLEEEDLLTISCLITDYNMPGKNGLDLIKWLHQKDKNISTVLLTGETDRKIVADGLRSGICDYLEKPVKKNTLIESIKRTIDTTTKNRQQDGRMSAVHKITNIYDRLNSISQSSQSLETMPKVITKFFPLQESGGDFVNVFTQGDDKLLVLAGDISGHDLTAGFISTYCQGMIRGMMQQNITISQIAESFNKFLVGEWNDQAKPNETTSLATCLLQFDLQKQEVEVARNGIPAPVSCKVNGQVCLLGEDNPPLGWFEPYHLSQSSYNITPNQVIRLWSDGLEDVALEAGFNAYSMAHYILNQKDTEQLHQLLENRADDIFVTQITSSPLTSEMSVHEPIFYETYNGEETNNIDNIQQIWKRSLQLVFPFISEDIIFNILLCLRESVINALIHGCQSSPNKNCTLSMSYDSVNEIIQIQVKDDGKGFDEVSANANNIGHISLGQQIIDSYAYKHEYLDNGSNLIMKFKTVDEEIFAT